MKAQPSAQFDMSPVLKMYMESIDVWKKNYDAFLKSGKDMQAASTGRFGEKAGEAARSAESNASAAGGAGRPCCTKRLNFRGKANT